MLVGSLWYSPTVFGKRWMMLMGKNTEEMRMQGGVAWSYIMSFVGSLVAAYVLALFVNYAGAITAWEGVQIGFWAWFGFVVTTSLGSILFEGRHKGLYFINNTYQFVTFVIMGAILAVWR